jgi:hypothetical protein
MDNESVQKLLAFLQPNPSGSIAGQSELRKVIAHARTSAQKIVDNDTRNLWLVVLQLVDVTYFGTIN